MGCTSVYAHQRPEVAAVAAWGIVGAYIAGNRGVLRGGICIVYGQRHIVYRIYNKRNIGRIAGAVWIT